VIQSEAAGIGGRQPSPPEADPEPLEAALFGALDPEPDPSPDFGLGSGGRPREPAESAAPASDFSDLSDRSDRSALPDLSCRSDPADFSCRSDPSDFSDFSDLPSLAPSALAPTGLAPLLAELRSFFAHPEPLNRMVGGANSLRRVPSAPHRAQKVGVGSFRPWSMSVRLPQAEQLYS